MKTRVHLAAQAALLSAGIACITAPSPAAALSLPDTSPEARLVGSSQQPAGMEYHIAGTPGGPAEFVLSVGDGSADLVIGDWGSDGGDRLGNVPGVGTSASFHSDLTSGPATTPAPTTSLPGSAMRVLPLTGNWCGEGDVVGFALPPHFHLGCTNSAPAEHTFAFGRPGDQFLAGDWDGDGKDSIAVRRGNIFHLKNSLSGGSADVTFAYGHPSDQVVVGDWDGDGKDSIAVRRGNIFHLKNSLSGGSADVTFSYGRPTDEPFSINPDGTGPATIGVRRIADPAPALAQAVDAFERRDVGGLASLGVAPEDAENLMARLVWPTGAAGRHMEVHRGIDRDGPFAFGALTYNGAPAGSIYLRLGTWDVPWQFSEFATLTP